MTRIQAPQTPADRWASEYHAPVLVNEVLALLRDKHHILDGTLGGGGHSLALLQHGAMVTALDRDPQAVAAARERLRDYEGARRDMRMDGAGTTAADVLNDTDERELARIFREYGDEPRAPRLAREVVRRRATRPFATSDDLVGAIRGALGPRTGPPDFARLFQAVRIEVNDELTRLERALPAL